MIVTLLLSHLVSCFWYLLAKLDDLGPETWVYRLEMLDYSNSALYLTSLYWTFQTLLTVGYGDIQSESNMELFFSSLWMFVGSFFYTFAIGNLSTVLSSMDTRESTKANKLATLNEFCKEAKID